MEEADRLRLMRTRGAAPAAPTTNASAAASAKTASCRKQAPQAWNKNVLEQVTRIREVLSMAPAQPRDELCCDWMGEQDEEVATPSTGASLGPLEFVNVIAFSAVGLEYAPQTRFRTLFLNELGVSSFLAHYDEGEAWYKSQGWYAALVKYSTAYKTTSKTRYLANALKNRYEDVFIFFSHVWLLDEDVVLPPPHHISGFVSIAVRLQAALAQPTLDAATWSVVKPNADCAVRETDIVETQMPLIRTQAAIDVFSRLLPEQLSSDWGVDSTWCRYLEAKYGRAQPACVVANSGGFRKIRPASTNYSRLEAEICMRAARQSLVAEMRTTRCVDQDARRAQIAAASGLPMVDAQLWPHTGSPASPTPTSTPTSAAAPAAAKQAHPNPAPKQPPPQQHAAPEQPPPQQHLPTVHRNESDGGAAGGGGAPQAHGVGGGEGAHGVGGGNSAAPSAPTMRFDTRLERAQEAEAPPQSRQQQQQAVWGPEFARSVGEQAGGEAAAPSAPTLVLPSAALRQRARASSRGRSPSASGEIGESWRDSPVALASGFDLAGDPIKLAADAAADPISPGDAAADPNLSLRGAEVRSAEAEARSDVGGPRPVRMYVYDIAALNLSSMCFDDIEYDSPLFDFTYETHLEAELRAVTEVVTEPAHADFFLLPVCLSQFWASTVTWNDEGSVVSSCGNCLQDHEASLTLGLGLSLGLSLSLSLTVTPTPTLTLPLTAYLPPTRTTRRVCLRRCAASAPGTTTTRGATWCRATAAPRTTSRATRGSSRGACRPPSPSCGTTRRHDADPEPPPSPQA